MYKIFKFVFFLAVCLFLSAQSFASDKTDIATARALSSANFSEKSEIISTLSDSHSATSLKILESLFDGDLFTAPKGGLYIQSQKGVFHTLNGVPKNGVGLKKISVNNKLRRQIKTAIIQKYIFSDDAQTRLEAAEYMFGRPAPKQLPLLSAALEKETNTSVKKQIIQAQAAALLKSDDASKEAIIAAIETLQDRGDQKSLNFIKPYIKSLDADISKLAQSACAKVERSLELWQFGQNAWYGLSLGSVLLLAAIGLAITFGAMGVINMAHGEMIMIGAYTTYIVQQIILGINPELMEFSLLIAVPTAFFVTALVGVIIERSVIQFLYGRPLETLLATWGVSLILQQTVRSIFGATNKQVVTPNWMAGAFEIGQMTITCNRLAILIFAFVVFAALLIVMNRTFFGLQIRAVTQNRPMANSMGIRSKWIDMMTFGLGSGVAGLAGVALSQIDNVSPNLGQTYIIDSFMVVVFGGAASLWGTFVGAFTLGGANKFMEPVFGAVLAKIIILVGIILFIQRRPRGLFALKGRAVDNG